MHNTDEKKGEDDDNGHEELVLSREPKVSWSRSGGQLLGGKAVEVQVNEEQLSHQVEQPRLPVNRCSASSMRNPKRHQDYFAPSMLQACAIAQSLSQEASELL